MSVHSVSSMARTCAHDHSGILFLIQTQVKKTIYIGYGSKYEVQIYFPKFPYTILSEPVERKEESEPNGEMPVVSKDIMAADDQDNFN